MGRIFLIIGAAVFACGFALQYGAWLAAWLSRLFGLHPPAASYEELVERVLVVLTQGQGFLRILAPWILMAIGLLLVAISRRLSGAVDPSVR